MAKIKTHKIEVNIDGSTSFMIVATIKNKVAGFATFKSKNKEIIWGEQLFVEKKHRKKGVGTKIINKIKRHCKKNKQEGLSMNVKLENKRARRLYESLGFVRTYDHDDETYSIFTWRVK